MINKKRYQKSNCYFTHIFPSCVHHISRFLWPGHVLHLTQPRLYSNLDLLGNFVDNHDELLGTMPRWGEATGETPAKCRWLGFTKHYSLPSITGYIYIYIIIYIIIYYIYIYIWVNYNDLTATEPWNHGSLEESSQNGLISGKWITIICPYIYISK